MITGGGDSGISNIGVLSPGNLSLAKNSAVCGRVSELFFRIAIRSSLECILACLFSIFFLFISVFLLLVTISSGMSMSWFIEVNGGDMEWSLVLHDLSEDTELLVVLLVNLGGGSKSLDRSVSKLVFGSFSTITWGSLCFEWLPQVCVITPFITGSSESCDAGFDDVFNTWNDGARGSWSFEDLRDWLSVLAKYEFKLELDAFLKSLLLNSLCNDSNPGECFCGSESLVVCEWVGVFGDDVAGS